MNELAQQIEAYLLEKGDWVSSETLCATFGLVSDRPLRQVGDEPGLCTKFAISRTNGGGGFKHVALATTKEWLRFKHSQRKHAVSVFIHVRDLDRRRHTVTRSVSNITFERDTGQALLAGIA
jgi:hypothetical protein